MVYEWNTSKDYWLNDTDRRKIEVLGEKRALVIFRLPQILHWLAWDPTRISAVISTYSFRRNLLRYSQLLHKLRCLKYSHHFCSVPAHTSFHPRSFLIPIRKATITFEGWLANSSQKHVSTLSLLHFNTGTDTTTCCQYTYFVLCIILHPLI